MADAGPVSPQERTRQTERTLLGGDPLALVSGELLRTVRVPFYRSSPTDIRKKLWVFDAHRNRVLSPSPVHRVL